MKAHITIVSREKKGFLGLFGKKPAVVDIEPIAETTVTKANPNKLLREFLRKLMLKTNLSRVSVKRLLIWGAW